MKENRFVIANTPGGGLPMLLVQDYVWWTNNEREILNWMAEHLPRGIEHQQGMVLSFATEQERMHFLLKWA